MREIRQWWRSAVLVVCSFGAACQSQEESDGVGEQEAHPGDVSDATGGAPGDAHEDTWDATSPSDARSPGDTLEAPADLGGPPDGAAPTCEALELVAEDRGDVPGWYHVQGRIPPGTSKVEGRCGGNGAEVIYRLRLPVAGAVEVTTAVYEGFYFHARTACNDPESERVCWNLLENTPTRFVGEAGDEVFLVVDTSSGLQDTAFDLQFRVVPYAEVGEACDPLIEANRCRPDADCSPAEVCRPAVRHYLPATCGLVDFPPPPGQDGSWVGVRVTPPERPFQVSGLRFSLMAGGVSALPYRVELTTGPDTFPPAEPSAQVVLEGMGPTTGIEYRNFQNVTAIERELDEPLVVPEREHLFVLVQILGTFPDVNAFGYCIINEGVPLDPERYYWSNGATTPFSWSTLASFGWDQPVPVDVFGQPVAAGPPAPWPPGRCEVACERLETCAPEAACACPSTVDAEWLGELCRQRCNSDVAREVLEAPDCPLAFDALRTHSLRFQRACDGISGSCDPPTFASIDAGGEHTCGLTTDGKTLCWGAEGGVEINPQGPIPPSMREAVEGEPVDPPGDEFAQVSAGSVQVCGLRADGTAACWGGLDNADSPAGYVFTSISTGRFATCGLRAQDGGVSCWQTGLETRDFPPPEEGRYVEVSLGMSNACARAESGRVTCWQAMPSFTAPIRSPSGTFLSISATNEYHPNSTVEGHACGVKSEGTITCWPAEGFDPGGPDDFGQLGPPEGEFTQVSVGNEFSCGLHVDGTVECWGGIEAAPVGVFEHISAGYIHACGLRPDGTVECWGSNRYGQSAPPGQ